MIDSNKGMSCGLGCWAMAAGAGFLAFVLMLVLGSFGVMQAIFLSAVLFVVLGALLSWILCGALPGPAVGADAETPAAPVAKTPASTPSQTAAAATDASTATSAPAAKPAATSASTTIKPSKALSGEDELRERKGEWKYNAGSDAAPAAKSAAAAADEGTKPMTYDAAPEGGGDDLKRIKGIGPKLEKTCNDMGFYTFAQVAAWTPAEVAWVDENLEGFKGRVTRDEWVAQAKQLAAGEETEFSKRVDDGDVY